jgi:hemoglobin
MNFIKSLERAPLAHQIGRDAIDQVVDDFYNQIQKHPTLSIPFSIVTHWKEHKEKIADFWWVVLGGQPQTSYKYDPVNKHFSAGFTQDLLEDWKALFFKVLAAHLTPGLTQAWQSRVELIGDNLSMQNDKLVQHNLSQQCY